MSLRHVIDIINNIAIADYYATPNIDYATE